MSICNLWCLKLHCIDKILLALKVQDKMRKVLVEGVVTKLVVASLESYVKLMSTSTYANEAGFHDVL